jgi:hypothetical protein
LSHFFQKTENKKAFFPWKKAFCIDKPRKKGYNGREVIPK